MNINLMTVNRLLRALREHLDDGSIQKAQVFFLIAQHPRGIAVSEIRRLANLTGASTSRNVLDLTELTSRKQPGPALVEVKQDPMERRYKTVFLTPKGQEVVNRVLGDLQPGDQED